MGGITGAVDDLVHGYETLVQSLPNLSKQIINVHADTEQMAKQLEVSLMTRLMIIFQELNGGYSYTAIC